MSARQKPDGLASLLQEHPNKRVVVFARTKYGSDKIVRRLQAIDINAAAIHGNKSQGQRERALKAFTNGDCKILIATDIAARGIDIKDVGLVVNYELPPVPEVYVHRIGRTARAGSSGVAVAFCAPDEIKHLRSIEKLIQMKIPGEGQVIEPQGEAEEESGKKRFRSRRKPNNLPNEKSVPKAGKSRRSAKKRRTETDSKDTVGSNNPNKNSPRKDKSHRETAGSNRSKSRRSFKRRKSKPN